MYRDSWKVVGTVLIHVNYSAHTREFTYMLMCRDSWKVVGTVLIHVNYSAHTREFTYMLIFRVFQGSAPSHPVCEPHINRLPCTGAVRDSRVPQVHGYLFPYEPPEWNCHSLIFNVNWTRNRLRFDRLIWGLVRDVIKIPRRTMTSWYQFQNLRCVTIATRILQWPPSQ